jgi:cytochrome P450
MFYLATHQQHCRTLIDEIRTKFGSEEDITIAATAKLPFLNAIINESFRIYSPLVAGMPRIAPKGGDTIAGVFVPEDVRSFAIITMTCQSLFILPMPSYCYIAAHPARHARQLSLTIIVIWQYQTTIGAQIYASFHSPSNFADPNVFLPKRWLPDTWTEADRRRFENDRKDVLHPASLGPRGCLGKQ